MKKKDLRKEFLAKRGKLSVHEVSDLSTSIKDRLIASFDFENVKYLHHFKPMKGKREVAVSILREAVFASYPSVRFVVPRINAAAKELEHIETDSDTVFRPDRMGIPEPVGGEIIAESLIDIVIVPLICFDRNGHRVGYGGGYYDRFLAKCRPDCLKIGVSFFDPIDEIEGIHDADIALDYCVTPDEVYDFQENRKS